MSLQCSCRPLAWFVSCESCRKPGMLRWKLRRRGRVMTCITPSGDVPDHRDVGSSIHQGAGDQERVKPKGTYHPRAALDSDRRESAVVRNCMFAVGRLVCES